MKYIFKNLVFVSNLKYLFRLVFAFIFIYFSPLYVSASNSDLNSVDRFDSSFIYQSDTLNFLRDLREVITKFNFSERGIVQMKSNENIFGVLEGNQSPMSCLNIVSLKAAKKTDPSLKLLLKVFMNVFGTNMTSFIGEVVCNPEDHSRHIRSIFSDSKGSEKGFIRKHGLKMTFPIETYSCNIII